MGDRGGLGAAGGAELAEDVRHVHAGGLRRDEQHRGDLPVAAARGDEPEHLAFPAGQRGEHRAVRQVGRGADPSPAGQVVQGPAQRPGREPVSDLGRLTPLLVGVVPAARLGERLGQPPPGAGDLVAVPGAERVQDRLPGLRGVVACGALVLRFGAGQPAAALGAQDELGPFGERRSPAGDVDQFRGRGRFGAGRFVVTAGPGLHGPVGARARATAAGRRTDGE